MGGIAHQSGVSKEGAGMGVAIRGQATDDLGPGSWGRRVTSEFCHLLCFRVRRGTGWNESRLVSGFRFR